MTQHEVYAIRGDYDGNTLTIPDTARYVYHVGYNEKIRTLIIPSTVVFIAGWNFSHLHNLVRIKTGISRRLLGFTANTVIMGPDIPTLKELKRWVLAGYSMNYTDQLWMSTLPTELCELVFSYIPSDAYR
jgi:hypothetical protein